MAPFGNRLRTPEFARRKRRLFYIKIAALAVVLAGSVAGLSYLTRLPALQISEINITGAEVVDEGELRSAVHEQLAGRYFFLFSKANIFLYPKTALEASVLSSFKRLKSAEFSFKNLHSVELLVTERPPQALWCGVTRDAGGEAPCYFLDPEGYIYTQAPTFTGPVYLRFFGALPQGEVVGMQFLPTEQFGAFVAFVEALGVQGVRPTELVLLDTEIELYLEDGTKILFLRKQELPRVLDNLLSVLLSPTFKGKEDLNLDYIDLRFGNKVYYKERGAAVETEPAE